MQAQRVSPQCLPAHSARKATLQSSAWCLVLPCPALPALPCLHCAAVPSCSSPEQYVVARQVCMHHTHLVKVHQSPSNLLHLRGQGRVHTRRGISGSCRASESVTPARVRAVVVATAAGLRQRTACPFGLPAWLM